MEGAGRGAGEPPESAWSILGQCGATLVSTSLPGRQLGLECLIARHNLRKLENLPGLLDRLHKRAHDARRAAKETLQTLRKELLDNGFTERQVGNSYICLCFLAGQALLIVISLLAFF